MDEVRYKLWPLITAWSDNEGLARATALADRFRELLPRQITTAQLAGLNGVVQSAPDIGKVTSFATHQASRASRAGRLDVKDYWDALHETLGGFEQEITQLMAKAGVPMPPEPSRRQRRQQGNPLDRLALWLAQEFVQHLVAHSLYIGGEKQEGD